MGDVSKSNVFRPSPNTHDLYELRLSRGAETLSCMEGRFQLPDQAKFNRPDPQRDWNWLVPHTINLYEYVGNDPINSWDPSGFGVKSLQIKWEGENQAYGLVNSMTIIRQLASPNLKELGFKDTAYHKNFHVNMVAELDTGDKAEDFEIVQSAIAIDDDVRVKSALGESDSPDHVVFDGESNSLVSFDSPGLSGMVFEEGDKAREVQAGDLYLGAFETTARNKNTGEGKTQYWSVEIRVNSDGKVVSHISYISQEDYENLRDRMVKIENQGTNE